MKEIATDFIRGDFDSLYASYDNIIKVLDGKEVLKFDEEITGQIMAATFSSELILADSDISNNTIVIVGARKYVVDYCINKRVKLIILVGNQTLSVEEFAQAKKN